MSEYSDVWDYPESEPFTDNDRKFIQQDYSKREHEDCSAEFTRIVNIYYKMYEMEPDRKADKQLKEQAMKKLEDITDQLELPTASVTDLFNLSITIDVLRSKHYFGSRFNYILGGKKGDPSAATSLPCRLETYIKEHNISYYCHEIYNYLFQCTDKSNSDTYKNVLIHYYEELIKEPNLESLAVILKCFDENLPKCEEYLGKTTIPNSSKEEFKDALKLFNSCKRSENYHLGLKLTQLKEIIQGQYADDAELLNWAKDQEDREIAQAAWEYGCVGNTTLILGVILIVAGFFTGVTFIPGIVLLVLWVLLFKTPLGNKIDYLRTGKEATKKAKK